jgi:tetratricopeptide (TPR) repeat protein
VLLQVAHFDKALELDDMLAITYFQRGVCYFMTGDYTSAMSDWEQTETVRVFFHPGFALNPIALPDRIIFGI